MVQGREIGTRSLRKGRDQESAVPDRSHHHAPESCNEGMCCTGSRVVIDDVNMNSCPRVLGGSRISEARILTGAK